MAPVTATFVASFDSFYDAVDKAVVTLKTFEQETENVGKAMQRMGDSFSGRKVIQDATMMVEAIEKIGGVSQLTDAELKRVGARVEEAAEKMRKLGIEVPPAFQDVLKATEGVRKANDETGLSFTKLVGSYVTGQAIIGAVTKAWETLTGVVNQSITSAQEAEAVEAKLTAALRAQGNDIPSVQAAFAGYAQSLQQTTIYSDDAITSAEAMLVLVGNVMPRDMQKALQATTNLASGLGIDLEQATRLVASAAEGNTAALKKQGVTLDETRVKSEGFNYVLDTINETMAGQASAAAATYQGRLAQLGNAWDNVLESIGRVVTQNKTLLTAFDLITKGISGTTGEMNQFKLLNEIISAAIINSAKAISVLLSALDYLQAGYQMARKASDRLIQAFINIAANVLIAHKAIMTAKSYIPGYGATATKAANDASAAIDQLRAYWQGLQDDQNDATASAKTWSSNIASLNGVISGFTGQLERTRGETVQLTTGVQENSAAWDTNTAAVDDTTTAQIKLNAEQRKYWNLIGERQMQDVAAGMAAHARATDDAARAQFEFNSWVRASAQPMELFETHLVGIGQLMSGNRVTLEKTIPLFQGFGDYLKTGLGPAVMGAFQGGGNVLKTIGGGLGGALTQAGGGIASKLGGAVASKLGSTIGAAVGSVVPVIGTILGGMAGGMIGKLFGPSERGKIDQELRGPLIAAAGGLDALNQKAAAAGVTLNAMLDANKPAEYEAAVKSLNDAFAFQAQSMATLDETAKRYGFTIEELGPAMQRQELDKQAQQLFKDWEVLNAAGIDTVNITARMADGVNAYINQATAMGQEIPEAMRPMLEQMVETGQLLDGNGEKITDLEASGISFSMSMSQGFQSLISEVGKLTDAIARGLGIALDKTSDSIENMPHQIPVEVVYKDPGYKTKHTVEVKYQTGNVPGYDVPGFQSGTHGKFVNFGSESLVMLHGKEAIVPESDLSSAPAGGAPVVVNIDARGALFNDPGSDLRLAERINQALSAKHGLTNKRRAA